VRKKKEGVPWAMKQAAPNALPAHPKPPSKAEKTLQTLRKEAGLLIEQVVDETTDCRWALVHWPVPVGQRCLDESLNVAYQALWHFYSDDATLSQEAFYLDVQLQLLRRMAYHLQRNEELPLELLMGYRLSPTEQAPRFYTTPSAQQQVMDSLAGFQQHLNEFAQLWQESFAFLKQLLAQKTPSDAFHWFASLWPKETGAFEDWRTLRQLRQHSQSLLKEPDAGTQQAKPLAAPSSLVVNPFKQQGLASGLKAGLPAPAAQPASGFAPTRFQPISFTQQR
jgi:hypothetical protein